MARNFIFATSVVALLLSACQSTNTCCVLPYPGEEPCVEQKCVHKYGLEVQPDYWVDCGRNGQVITTQRDGVVISQSYANGMLNGVSSYSFPHSEQPQKVEVYDNDQLVSRFIYHLTGSPTSSIEYSSPEIWTQTVWYDSGNPKCVEKFERNLLLSGDYYNLENKRDTWVCNGFGERYNRDSFGQVTSVDTIRGGEMVTRVIQYPNGSPQEVIPFVNGLVHGARKTYYPAGEPMTIEFWDNGQQNGLTTVFQNGEKYAEVPYLGGKKNGLERRFKDGSVCTQEITWFENRMHGPSYTYLGDSVQTDWFYNGRLSTRSNFESFAVPKKGS